MFLKEYLKKEKMTIPEAASALGVHKNHLFMICRKKRFPGYPLAKEIEQWTQGEVTAEEMLKDKPQVQCCPTCHQKIPADKRKMKKLANSLLQTD